MNEIKNNVSNFIFPAGVSTQSSVIAGPAKCAKTRILFEAMCEMLVAGKKVSYIAHEIFFTEIDSHLRPVMNRLFAHIEDDDEREIVIKQHNRNLLAYQSLSLFTTEREEGRAEGVLFCDVLYEGKDGTPQEVLDKLTHLKQTTDLSFVYAIQTRDMTLNLESITKSHLFGLLDSVDNVTSLERHGSVVTLRDIKNKNNDSTLEYTID
jgi:hypothetical protein